MGVLRGGAGAVFYSFVETISIFKRLKYVRKQPIIIEKGHLPESTRIPQRGPKLMKVKVALFKMKIKEINKVVNVEELKEWTRYPGDMENSFPPDTKQDICEDALYSMDWSGKKMIYLSAN